MERRRLPTEAWPGFAPRVARVRSPRSSRVAIGDDQDVGPPQRLGVPRGRDRLQEQAAHGQEPAALQDNGPVQPGREAQGDRQCDETCAPSLARQLGPQAAAGRGEGPQQMAAHGLQADVLGRVAVALPAALALPAA